MTLCVLPVRLAKLDALKPLVYAGTLFFTWGEGRPAGNTSKALARINRLCNSMNKYNLLLSLGLKHIGVNFDGYKKY